MSLTTKTQKLPSPLTVATDLLWGGWRTFSVAAAVQLDVFTAIAAGKRTAKEIAAETRTKETMIRRLLDTLIALKYLERAGDRYSLSPHAATFLVRGSELFMEGAGRFAIGQMMPWLQLAEVIRNGARIAPTADEAARADFFTMLVKVIFPVNYVAAKFALSGLPASSRSRIRNVLDVGAGAAAWSIPFAQANKATRVTVVDFPQVTPVTRDYAAKFGVADQYEYHEGDLYRADLGAGRYDMVILGHIIHGEGRNAGRDLLRRSVEALGDRGMLLIAEFIPTDDRKGPALSMLFGINMMLNTLDGDVYTMKDYRGWLKEAGCKTVKVIRNAAAPSPLILATK